MFTIFVNLAKRSSTGGGGDVSAGVGPGAGADTGADSGAGADTGADDDGAGVDDGAEAGAVEPLVVGAPFGGAVIGVPRLPSSKLKPAPPAFPVADDRRLIVAPFEATRRFPGPPPDVPVAVVLSVPDSSSFMSSGTDN